MAKLIADQELKHPIPLNIANLVPSLADRMFLYGQTFRWKFADKILVRVDLILIS